MRDACCSHPVRRCTSIASRQICVDGGHSKHTRVSARAPKRRDAARAQGDDVYPVNNSAFSAP